MPTQLAIGLLSQKLCHYLDQGRILNDRLMKGRALNGLFDLSKLNVVYANVLKAFEL